MLTCEHQKHRVLGKIIHVLPHHPRKKNSGVRSVQTENLLFRAVIHLYFGRPGDIDKHKLRVIVCVLAADDILI